MYKLFRSIVIISAALFVVWYLMPYFDYLWLTDEELTLANASNYGSYIPNHPLIYWGWFTIWLVLFLGVFLFIPVARTGYLVMTIVSVVANLFWGFVVLDPIAATMGYLISLGDGAIITMAYLTSVANNFANTPNKSLNQIGAKDAPPELAPL